MVKDKTRKGEIKLTDAAAILGIPAWQLYRRAVAGTVPSRQRRPGCARRFDRRVIEHLAEYGVVVRVA
jgi:hypothetical protein